MRAPEYWKRYRCLLMVYNEERRLTLRDILQDACQHPLACTEIVCSVLEQQAGRPITDTGS